VSGCAGDKRNLRTQHFLCSHFTTRWTGKVRFPTL